MKWHPSTSKIPNTPFCCQTVHLIYRCHFCASLACLTYCLQKSLLASSSPSVGAKSLFISTAAYNLLSFCFSLQVMFPSSSPSSPLHNPLALPSAFFLWEQQGDQLTTAGPNTEVTAGTHRNNHRGPGLAFPFSRVQRGRNIFWAGNTPNCAGHPQLVHLVNHHCPSNCKVPQELKGHCQD